MILDVALIAVLVPVLFMILAALILTVVCACLWRNRYFNHKRTFLKLMNLSELFYYDYRSLFNRKKNSEGTYDLPHWDRTGIQVYSPADQFV